MDRMLIGWNRPRRPPRRIKTAYACFVKRWYRLMRYWVGTRKPQIIYRALAQYWRNLDEKGRRTFVDTHEQDVDRYYKERDNWARHFPGRLPKMRRRRKAENAPKRGRNAFVIFRMDNWYSMKEANPTVSQQKLLCMVAARWRAMSEEEKQKYWDQAEVEHVRYSIEMSQFRHQSALMDAERRFRNYLDRTEAVRRRETKMERKMTEARRRLERLRAYMDMG